MLQISNCSGSIVSGLYDRGHRPVGLPGRVARPLRHPDGSPEGPQPIRCSGFRQSSQGVHQGPHRHSDSSCNLFALFLVN